MDKMWLNSFADEVMLAEIDTNQFADELILPKFTPSSFWRINSSETATDQFADELIWPKGSATPTNF